MTDPSLVESGDEPLVRLVTWDGPWPDDDPDANFKADVAAYSLADPLATIGNLSRNLDVPVGAVVRYVLAKWASGGAEALLELGPTTVERLVAVVDRAEEAGTDEARLEGWEQLTAMLGWLRQGLDAPETTYPDGGATP